MSSNISDDPSVDSIPVPFVQVDVPRSDLISILLRRPFSSSISGI
jgi:hypothetical protein